MIAYHGDPTVKAKYLARVRAHRAADELVQGTGWESNGQTRGCAVGCTLDAYDHARYPIELGVPLQLAYLEDELFELQAADVAMSWPERFLDAISVGADLSRVWPEWAIWMLTDPEHGVLQYAQSRPDCVTAIERVAQLYREGGSEEEFRAAARAARAAADAAYAAYAASYARRAASYAAASAAAASADDADAAAVAAVARTRWVTAACDKLTALLAAAPMEAGIAK